MFAPPSLPRLPPWVGAADRALSFAAARICVVRSATAVNAAEELARLEGAWTAGREVAPSFQWDARPAPADLLRGLDALATRFDAEPPLGPLYAARARELLLDAAIIEAVGTPAIRALAARRFDVGSEARVEAWARAWVEMAPPPPEPACVVTDDERDPRSLVTRMRAEIGRRRLPMRVVVQPGLASLAATSDDAVVVVAARRVTVADVERTVLHEIEGHAEPLVCAVRRGFGLGAVGSARGIDDQEGRALLLERRAGHHGPARLRELGLRHVAARACLAGADFVEIARSLRGREASVASAVRIAARVLRGGGLAREVVYLSALSRVERALRAEPSLDGWLASGRVSVEAARVLVEALGLAA